MTESQHSMSEPLHNSGSLQTPEERDRNSVSRTSATFEGGITAECPREDPNSVQPSVTEAKPKLTV